MNKKFKYWLLSGIFLTIIIAITLVISGCIGGENGGETGDAQVDESSGDKEPLKEAGEKASDNAKKSLSSILNLGTPSGYMVSYDITGKDAGETSEMTMYFSGVKMRVDMKNLEGSASIFKDGIKIYMCMQQEGKWMCIKFKEDVAPELADISDTFEDDPGNAIYDGIEIIAGVTAECYKYESGGTKQRYCVHPEKYLALLAETYDGGNLEYRMIATKVDLNAPEDSVFELPAEPVDLEGLMEGNIENYEDLMGDDIENFDDGSGQEGNGEEDEDEGSDEEDEEDEGSGDEDTVDMDPCERCYEIPTEEGRDICLEHCKGFV